MGTDTVTGKSPASLDAPAAAPDWAEVRREFPTTERFVYPDVARKGILPRVVEAAMGDWMADVYGRAGTDAFAMEGIEATRAAVAETYGAPERASR